MKKNFATLCVSVLTMAVSAVTFAADSRVTIKVLYDNYAGHEACGTDWGFSCIVEGLEKTILFDTGRKGELLLSNGSKLNVSPSNVEIVVISHNHHDHTGGLLPFLNENHDVSVYLPAETPKELVEKVRLSGAHAKVVTQTTPICEGATILGPMGDQIVEQSLVLNTRKGLVIITGCSHPGIATIAKRAKKQFQCDIYMILGGTHLLRHSEVELTKVIDELKSLGVQKVAASHCSGDTAIARFKDEFDSDFVKLGVGRIIQVGQD